MSSDESVAGVMSEILKSVPDIFVDGRDKTEARIDHEPALAHFLEHFALAVEHILLALRHTENEAEWEVSHAVVEIVDFLVLGR